MNLKESELFVFIGSMDNARKGMFVNICTSTKRKKSQHASISLKKDFAKKEINVYIVMSSQQTSA
jgi:hypothetical protein